MSFINVVFGYLKSNNVDTSGMSAKEAIDKYNELRAVDTAKKFNASVDGEDEQRIADGRKEVDKSSKKEVKLSKEEYAVVKQEVMRKNSSGKGKYPIDCTYTANNFVVYENYGLDNFKVIVKLNIEKDFDKIKKYQKQIKFKEIKSGE